MPKILVVGNILEKGIYVRKKIRFTVNMVITSR